MGVSLLMNLPDRNGQYVILQQKSAQLAFYLPPQKILRDKTKGRRQTKVLVRKEGRGTNDRQSTYGKGTEKNRWWIGVGKREREDWRIGSTWKKNEGNTCTTAMHITCKSRDVILQRPFPDRYHDRGWAGDVKKLNHVLHALPYPVFPHGRPSLKWCLLTLKKKKQHEIIWINEAAILKQTNELIAAMTCSWLSGRKRNK